MLALDLTGGLLEVHAFTGGVPCCGRCGTPFPGGEAPDDDGPEDDAGFDGTIPVSPFWRNGACGAFQGEFISRAFDGIPLNSVLLMMG